MTYTERYGPQIITIQWSPTIDPDTGCRVATVSYCDGTINVFRSWEQLNAMQRQCDDQNLEAQTNNCIVAVPRHPHDLTAEQMADQDNVDPKAWISRADGFHIYLHAGTRMRVICETHPDWTFGSSDRATALGIDVPDRDSAEMAKQFVDRFLDYLSMNNLNALIPALLVEYQNQLEIRHIYAERGNSTTK